MISDFKYLESKDRKIHRTYARNDSFSRTKMALENSHKYLNQLEDYTGTTYELEKMYHGAIPDFSAGAMENWGLITYKEQYLIGDEDSHHDDFFEILLTVSHELAHQFFGNLVTCETWTEIWLNEGFATLFEYFLIEKVQPELTPQQFFNVHKLQLVLQIDALESTHPVIYENDRIYEIIYYKGGSVIRMFQYLVGDTIFKNSLQLYLKNK